MKEKMELTKIVLMDKFVHASLSRHIEDGDVAHTLNALVVLDFSDKNVMDLTLNEIQSAALDRLKLDA